jgi:hypothetical protein
MTNLLPPDKGFRQQSEAVAIAAKIMNSKIRRHVVEDGCNCCKRALEMNIEMIEAKGTGGSAQHEVSLSQSSLQPPSAAAHSRCQSDGQNEAL